jgi:hypothetical protein
MNFVNNFFLFNFKGTVVILIIKKDTIMVETDDHTNELNQRNITKKSYNYY